MPISYLKKIGVAEGFKVFCDWTKLRLNDQDNKLLSTARLVFLSKTNKEIIKDHTEYRCLAVQPTFIRILEHIVFSQVDRKKIIETQYDE